MNRNVHRYDDLLDLEHPTSEKHPRMPLKNRAAQFAPFAALTGYEDELDETARLTDEKIELTQDEKDRINETLQKIRLRIKDMPEVSVVYFVKDARKPGGSYETYTGRVKKIDEISGTLLFAGENPNAPAKMIALENILSLKVTAADDSSGS